VCVGFALDDDEPSPKFQKYDAMKPSGSLADEAKLTKSGLVPEVGEAEILKVGGEFGGGGGGATLPPSVLDRITPSFINAPGPESR